MAATDLISDFIATNTNALRFVLKSSFPLEDWVLVRLPDTGRLVTYVASELDAGSSPEIPSRYVGPISSATAKPRPKDTVILFDLRGDGMTVAEIERARIEAELGAPYVVDVRNHLPAPWPKGWSGPYALHIPDAYRIDADDCQVLARVEEAWDDEHADPSGNPRHLWRLQIGVTRAMSAVPPDDHQLAAITARFRRCGPWAERTHLYPQRHPSRRVFAAEVGDGRQGEGWREVLPLPDAVLGPPPGWNPIGGFSDRPLVFRIEGTELHVQWEPSPGAPFFEAAVGSSGKPSTFSIRAARRKPSDDEVGTVFAMLGAPTFSETKPSRPGADGDTHARHFVSTAGWLRRPSGLA